MASNNELYHHGVLGMKWGVRRYQDYGEGGYNPKKVKRKVKSSYNYKDSDEYKNAGRSKKRSMSVDYNFNRSKYGTKGANRIEYAKQVEGKSSKVAEKPEKRRATGRLIGTYLVMDYLTGGPVSGLVGSGARYVNNMKANIGTTTTMANLYSNNAGGLNEVKGGFTFGFKHAKAGKRFCKMMGVD